MISVTKMESSVSAESPKTILRIRCYIQSTSLLEVRIDIAGEGKNENRYDG